LTWLSAEHDQDDRPNEWHQTYELPPTTAAGVMEASRGGGDGRDQDAESKNDDEETE
jgi:hypothetical protein